MPSPNDGTRVLVVDDQAEMAEMLADDLHDRGYGATAVSSGRDALRILRMERVDVLVTDLRMPGLDGLNLLRSSIRLDPSRPVIMMTAYGTLVTAIEATEGGVFYYLMKPFRIESLIRILEQALQKH
jgi:DNA-binding NtrC family response regulator